MGQDLYSGLIKSQYEISCFTHHRHSLILESFTHVCSHLEFQALDKNKAVFKKWINQKLGFFVSVQDLSKICPKKFYRKVSFSGITKYI